MRRKIWTAVMVLILWISGVFFSGCTVAQRQEILEEAKNYAVAQGRTIIDGAVAKLEKKASEAEATQLAALDQQLSVFKIVDAETGAETGTKTWKDFDADRSGHLEPVELAKVGSFITAQTARRVAVGEIDKNALGQTGKSTGTTLAALLALFLARRGAGAVAKKISPGGGGTSTTPPAGGGTSSG